jgi:hypothetical protein
VLSTGPAAKLAVRIPTEQLADLDALADAEGVTRSMLVREALSLLLDRSCFIAHIALLMTTPEQPTTPPPPDDFVQEMAAA